MMKNKIYRLVIKRCLDLLLSFLLSLPAALLILLSYIAIKVETRGPAFYIQQRPGYKSRLFNLYKLRTMITQTQRDGKPLSDMERISKSGRIIRALSIDELPQLLNIVKGEMSFIGPRPLLKEYLPLYSSRQKRRHEVCPGISGWAQVNGRNESTWEQKFEHDIWYVDHLSFLLDVRIFWMTIRNVISRHGVNAGADETMSVFTGNEVFKPREKT